MMINKTSTSMIRANLQSSSFCAFQKCGAGQRLKLQVIGSLSGHEPLFKGPSFFL